MKEPGIKQEGRGAANEEKNGVYNQMYGKEQDRSREYGLKG